MAHIQMTEFHCHLSRSSLFWEVGGSEKIIQSKNILSISSNVLRFHITFISVRYLLMNSKVIFHVTPSDSVHLGGSNAGMIKGRHVHLL